MVGKTNARETAIHSPIIVVEGAGQEHDLSTECRKAFSTLLASLGLQRHPRIVCGGGRSQAFDKFRTFIMQKKEALLLIDSEGPVQCDISPWGFLEKAGENWDWLSPERQRDDDCHFMVQCMENWFLASVPPMRVGPKNVPIQATMTECQNPESTNKTRVYDILDKAYKKAGQHEYNKGRHSFMLLAKVDAEQLGKVAPWANRFFEEVKKRCGVRT